MRRCDTVVPPRAGNICINSHILVQESRCIPAYMLSADTFAVIGVLVQMEIMSPLVGANVSTKSGFGDRS